MRMAYTFLWAVSTLLVSTAGQAQADEPFQSGSFKQACALAAQTKKIVLVDFYTTWCGPCKRLDAVTWKDKTVRDWLAKTAICRKIDAEKETELADRYKIRAYPTILLLKANGTEIDRITGFREPKEFLTEARQALSGQDSIARAKAKLKAAGGDKPMERMNYARALQEKGRYAEALKEFLWCLDEGNKHDVGYAGVRLSFLLADIQSLGNEYPPAIDALKQRRDAARSSLEKGGASFEAAMEFTSYNEHLGDEELTLTVYDSLRQRGVSVPSVLFDQVVELLIAKKRYADLVAAAGDIPGRVDREIEMNKSLLSTAQSDKGLRSYLVQHTVDMAAGLFEALAGAGKSAEADAVRDKVLKFDASTATFIALVKHATRADSKVTVQRVLDIAKARLSATECKKVEQAAQ